LSAQRTSEFEISKAVLRILATMPNGEATTLQLKRRVREEVKLTDDDRKPSDTRDGEEMWEQIVRNIVSHKKVAGNIVYEGFANSPSRGKLRITASGREHTKNLK
jgi:hypothetical protein